jgi:hypothetical protein
MLILGSSGCGGGGADQPDLVPVSGTVKLDGQPGLGVAVMFFPVGETRGTTYYANTDQSGQYELSAADGQKGAPVGEYKVTCSKYVMPDGSPFTSDGSQSPEMAGAKELLLPKYSDQSQTELTAKVPAGGGTVDFDVQSK